jgi:hypothetical protein
MFAGMICTRCSPLQVAKDAIYDARSICMREYASAPDVVVYGDPRFTFAYVPSHLHHMVFELVKNSLRAVNDRFDDYSDEPPPVRLVVAEGGEDVTIKVRKLVSFITVTPRAAVRVQSSEMCFWYFPLMLCIDIVSVVVSSASYVMVLLSLRCRHGKLERAGVHTESVGGTSGLLMRAGESRGDVAAHQALRRGHCKGSLS